MTTNRTETSHAPERAAVAFHPPLLLLALIGAGFIGDWLLPVPFLPSSLTVPTGIPVVLVALTFFAWAIVTMLRGGTSVPTNTETNAIVVTGPYRVSRNPIYVSMVLLLIGIGCWANSVWFLAFAVLDAVALHIGVIIPEERYLEDKFGETYLSYKRTVRRWI